MIRAADIDEEGRRTFYTGGGQFSGPQNGFAIAGDYCAAASFLGIAGAIAVYGYDGVPVPIGFLVAWLVACCLVPNCFATRTIHDGRRSELPAEAGPCGWRRHCRRLVVSLFYLLAQMAGAGGLVALLLNIKDFAGQADRRRGRRCAD
ncbi:hypothetical protein GS540_19225 [Rhodococcus hoagii]|nr:hypothetical protein [Prescottella equi]